MLCLFAWTLTERNRDYDPSDDYIDELREIFSPSEPANAEWNSQTKKLVKSKIRQVIALRKKTNYKEVFNEDAKSIQFMAGEIGQSPIVPRGGVFLSDDGDYSDVDQQERVTKLTELISMLDGPSNFMTTPDENKVEISLYELTSFALKPEPVLDIIKFNWSQVFKMSSSLVIQAFLFNHTNLKTETN